MGAQGQARGAVISHHLFPFTHDRQLDLGLDSLLAQLACPLIDRGEEREGASPSVICSFYVPPVPKLNQGAWRTGKGRFSTDC